MSGSSGNNLSIEVSIRPDGSTFTFSKGDGTSLEIASSFRTNRLTSLRANLRNRLASFAVAAKEASALAEPAKWKGLDVAMKHLRGAGQELGYALFPVNDVQRIQEFCREACYWLQQPDGMPHVELIVDAIDMAPLEFVPLFRRAAAGQVTDALSFEEEARSYLGFSSIVRRTLRQIPDQVSFLDALPHLQAAVFRYADVRAVSDVLPVLTECGVSFTSPVPVGQMTSPDLRATVYDSLLNGTQQLLYFGCHCDTTNPVSGLHQILLAHNRSLEHSVTLGDIVGHFYSYGPRGTRGPLVFMNACGGAAVMPDGVGSFPSFFLEQKFRGYIGTETKIPDRTAAEFASCFFRDFLGGRPLGESILQARRNLLRRGNPLGILYTAYAASELVVRRTI